MSIKDGTHHHQDKKTYRDHTHHSSEIPHERGVKEDILQGAHRFSELTDHYMKLYEHEEPQKHDPINNAPKMNTPHMEPLPLLSTKIVKKHNGHEFAIMKISEYTWQDQVSLSER